MLMPSVQTWEQFTEANEHGGKSAAGNDEGNCHDYEYHAESLAHGEYLAEYRYAEEYGGDGFKGTEYGGGSGTYALYGTGGAEKRDACGEYGKGNNVEPQVPFGGQVYAASHCKAHYVDRQTKEQHIERYL